MTDKNGIPVTAGTETVDDDVLFDGEHYYRLYVAPDGSFEMVGYGYIHNVDQDTLSRFERIGKYQDNKHLLEVD